MRGGLQELLTSILRSREQRAKSVFDRALPGRARLVGVGIGGRDKQRAWRDDRERGYANTFPRGLLVLFIPPGPGGRHSTQCLDAPVVRALSGGERNDEQPACDEAHELLVRQVREWDRELPAGPHGHARDRRAVVRRRELRHARCWRRRILVECECLLGVVVAPCGCDRDSEGFVLALSLDFCFGEDPTANRKGQTRTDPYQQFWRGRATHSAISIALRFHHPNSTFGILFPAQNVSSSSHLVNWSSSLTNRTGGVALVGAYNGLLVLSSPFRLPGLARGFVFQSVLSFECVPPLVTWRSSFSPGSISTTTSSSSSSSSETYL